MVFASIKAGLYQIWQNKRIVFAFYIANLAIGLLMMMPFRQTLRNFIGNSMRGETLGGMINFDFIMEFSKYNANFFAADAISWLFLSGLVLYLMINAFLAGGAIAVFQSMLGRNYCISDEVLKLLKKKKLPVTVINALAPLRNEVFQEKDQLLARLGDVLGESDMAEWGEKIGIFSRRRFISRFQFNNAALERLKNSDITKSLHEKINSLAGQDFRKEARLVKSLEAALDADEKEHIPAITALAKYRYSNTDFWGNAGRFFGRFLRIGLLTLGFMVLLALIFFMFKTMIYYLFFGEDAYEGVLYWGRWLQVFLFYLAFLIAVLVADYARIHTVSTDEKSAIKAFVYGCRYVWRYFRRTLTLAFSFSLIGVLLLAIYNPIADLFNAPSGIIIFLLFIWQQCYIFVKMALRLALYSGETYLHGHLKIG